MSVNVSYRISRIFIVYAIDPSTNPSSISAEKLNGCDINCGAYALHTPDHAIAVYVVHDIVIITVVPDRLRVLCLIDHLSVFHEELRIIHSGASGL